MWRRADVTGCDCLAQSCILQLAPLLGRATQLQVEHESSFLLSSLRVKEREAEAPAAIAVPADRHLLAAPVISVPTLSARVPLKYTHHCWWARMTTR